MSTIANGLHRDPQMESLLQNRRLELELKGSGLSMPEVILRALPASWRMPENMAAHIIGEPTPWEAGARLMHAENSQAWAVFLQANRPFHNNRSAVVKCQEAATKEKRPIHCMVDIMS